MAQRKTEFVLGEYYHLYNRGNSKQTIFLDDSDRERFIKLLYLCNSTKKFNFRQDIVERKIDAWDFDRGETLVSVGAWVLMPNHFHIYLSPRPGLGELDGDTAVNFMQKLGTSYSMYFNKKYKRTGTLFEGRFKSVRIETDEQAKYLFSYIHLNPIKLIDSKWRENGIQDHTEALKFLGIYPWSSYQDFRESKRIQQKILSIKNFPEYFDDVTMFDKEIFDWLKFGDEENVEVFNVY